MPYFLEVTDLQVRSLDVDYRELSWKIANTNEDVLDYTFQVFRSESREGPYDAISTTFEDRYLFIDNAPLSFHANRVLFYKLRVTHKASGEYKDCEPVAQEPKADLMAVELRRHMSLLFREFSGRRCWHFPLRTFGQRCVCFSEVRQKSNRSGCKLCFDTGFVRGYLYPIEIWMQIEPNIKNEQNSALGPMHAQNTTGRCSDHLAIKPRDVIVEGENNRWRVVTVQQAELVRAPIFQEVKLHGIYASDIEYGLPLNFDQAFRDISLSPARNYTNPTNLENFLDEEIPGIFSLYRTSYTDPYK